MSNVVEASFDKPSTISPEDPTTSDSSLGLTVSAQTKTQGHYKFYGSLGNQVPTLVKSSGAYKFYGGIHGQAVSE